MQTSNQSSFRVSRVWRSCWYLLLFISIVLAYLFFLCGYNARQLVLKANACKMTYSNRDKLEVQLYPHCGKRCPYKLFKLSNARKRGVLNPQPILFVPGHLGSADQARSFASLMHNEDGFFQHFALDFGAHSTLESGASHGSGVLAQAAAVNQALHRIIRMYQIAESPLFGSDATKDVRIIIIGHSVGGFVARVALLMSNYPSSPCSVGDIVQLSAPNERPPFSPDPSLEVLYHTAAQAYRNSYLNRVTSACKSFRSRALHPKVLMNITRADYDYLCPSTCIPETRILSIAGGEIDMQVSSRMTLMNSAYAMRKGRSKEANESIVNVSHSDSNSSSFSGGIVGRLLLSLTNPLQSVISGIAAPSKADNNSSLLSVDRGKVDEMSKSEMTDTIPDTAEATVVNDTDANPPEHSDEGINRNNQTNLRESEISHAGSAEPIMNTIGTTDEVPFPLLDNEADESNDASMLDVNNVTSGAIAADHTDEHTENNSQRMSFPIVNIRMSQLTDVGFPTDHVAMMWCYQLISSICNTLRRITFIEAEERMISWVDVLPLHQNYSTSLQVGLQIGAPLAVQFDAFNQAQDIDNGFIFESLQLSHFLVKMVYYSAFKYFNNHWIKIMISYMLVSILVLTVPLLRLLAGYQHDSRIVHRVDSFSILQPWSLLSADLILAGVVNGVHRLSLSPGIDQAPSLLWQLVGVACLAKIVYDWYVQGSYYNVLLSYEETLYWVVSLLMVLPLRSIIAFALRILQSISEYILVRFYKLLRLTLYNKSVRVASRGWWKASRQYFLRYVPFADVITKMMRGSVFPTVAAALWLSIYFSTASRRMELSILGGSFLYIMCIFSVTFYIIMIAGIVLGIGYFPLSASTAAEQDRYFFLELCMLYLPTAFFGLPSVWFSYRLLFGTSQFAAALIPVLGALRLFTIETLIFSVSTASIGLHLWAMRYNMAMLNDVPVWQTLHDFMGPEVVEAVRDIYPDTFEELSPFLYPENNYGGKASSGDCIHEDGGRFAVFECILETDLPNVEEKASQIQDNVWLGSTYRVVYCKCAKDFTLKERSEWCSWCLCRRCGGKNLRPLYESSLYVSTVPFCSDAFLLFTLYVSVWYSAHFLEDHPHRYLHVAAVIAAVFFATHLLRYKSERR